MNIYLKQTIMQLAINILQLAINTIFCTSFWQQMSLLIWGIEPCCLLLGFMDRTQPGYFGNNDTNRFLNFIKRIVNILELEMILTILTFWIKVICWLIPWRWSPITPSHAHQVSGWEDSVLSVAPDHTTAISGWESKKAKLSGAVWVDG